MNGKKDIRGQRTSGCSGQVSTLAADPSVRIAKKDRGKIIYGQ